MALYKSSGVFYSGFSILVPASDAGSVTVVALSHGRASAPEIAFTRDDGPAMPIAIVTGSGGLIGSESVGTSSSRLRRGRPRERHARALLRRGGLDAPHVSSACRASYAEFRSRRDRHPRRATASTALFATHARHVELVDPHGRAAVPRLGGVGPADRLRRQRQRHAEPARGDARRTRPRRRSSSRSTNKVYGDLPNQLPLDRARDAARAARGPQLLPRHRHDDVDRQSTHSLFGVSKVAADLLVQEYGRYFEHADGVLPRRLPTGPNHAGAQLHGFLSYLMRCTMTGDAVHGLRLRRQAGARQHPQRRPRRVRSPRSTRAARRPPSTTSAAGGRATARCSRRSRSCEEIAGRELDWTLGDRAAIGDHRWWISDLDAVPGATTRRGATDVRRRGDPARDPRRERRALVGRGAA